MIDHLLTPGYSTERWTEDIDTWGGTIQDWVEEIPDFAGHINIPKTVQGLTFRVGQDDLAIDGILYCSIGLDIVEGDKVISPDNKEWKVLHAPTRRTPVDGRGFMELKLELMR